MKRKITAIVMTILLSGLTLTTIAMAEQSLSTPTSGGGSGEGVIVPRPYYRPQMMYGYGVNKDSIGGELEVEQVVFLKIDCPTRYYLVMGDDIYRMKEIYTNYDWQTGTKVMQYESEAGQIMTVVIQNFDYGSKSISAEFKDYLITFYAGYYYPRPVTGPVELEIEPVSPMGNKELPYGIAKKVGINTEEVFTEVEPIAEWME